MSELPEPRARRAIDGRLPDIPYYKASQGGKRAEIPGPGSKPPFFMNRCMSWAFDGPVVQRVAPHFYKPKQET